MKRRSEKTAFYGVMLGLALILGYVEFLLPLNFGVPGIKLGLSNIVTVFVLYKIGFKQSFTLNVLRIIISSILFGNVFGAVYSLCGGILSVVSMYYLKKTNLFSIVGVSVAGAVINNLGQVVIASVLISTVQILGYLPFLSFSGVIMGALIGVLVTLIINKLPKTFY